MRKRTRCEHDYHFGGVKNPCGKILADIIGDEFEEKEGEVIVTGLKEVVLKCARKGCNRKTTIKAKEDKNNE